MPSLTTDPIGHRWSGATNEADTIPTIPLDDAEALLGFTPFITEVQNGVGALHDLPPITYFLHLNLAGIEAQKLNRRTRA